MTWKRDSRQSVSWAKLVTIRQLNFSNNPNRGPRVSIQRSILESSKSEIAKSNCDETEGVSGGLLLRMQIHKALPKLAPVVVGGNLEKVRRLDRCRDRSLRRLHDRRQVAAVNDDLLHRRHARGQP